MRPYDQDIHRRRLQGRSWCVAGYTTIESRCLSKAGETSRFQLEEIEELAPENLPTGKEVSAWAKLGLVSFCIDFLMGR